MSKKKEPQKFKTEAIHSKFATKGKKNIPIPDKTSVKEAKEWVDYHQV